MENKTKGLIGAGIVTLAAGLFGFWKYKNMTPEEKALLKDKARKAGDTLKDTYEDVEGQVSSRLTQLKDTLARETQKAQRSTENTVEIIEAEISNA